MKILLVHSRYTVPGGEEGVFVSEGKLLEEMGCTVIRHETANSVMENYSMARKAATTIWNRRAVKELQSLIQREKPDLVHFHNTFPYLSPAVFISPHREGIPSVVTLHNYRWLCPNGLFFRNNAPCQSCLNSKFLIPALRFRCYRESLGATLVVVLMTLIHRVIGTFKRSPNVIILLNSFQKKLFIKAGFDECLLKIKPNFVEDPTPNGISLPPQGTPFLFVGRLSAEKGISDLLALWKREPKLPRLRIIGDGPLRSETKEASGDNGIEYLGRLSPSETREEMANSRALIIASHWYEGMPLVILEAFSVGLPVIAPNLGGLPSVVTNGINGMVYEAGNPYPTLLHYLRQNELETKKLRKGARTTYEDLYTPRKNGETLLKIYRDIVKQDK